MKPPKLDVGLIWAKIMNIWGQVGTVAGIANTIMMIGVFYTTTLYPQVKIPLWLYVLIICIGVCLVIWFIVKVGISGWFRFFSHNSEIEQVKKDVAELNRKQDLMLSHFGINNNTKGNKE